MPKVTVKLVTGQGQDCKVLQTRRVDKPGVFRPNWLADNGINKIVLSKTETRVYVDGLEEPIITQGVMQVRSLEKGMSDFAVHISPQT